jgi:hypothetical protein
MVALVVVVMEDTLLLVALEPQDKVIMVVQVLVIVPTMVALAVVHPLLVLLVQPLLVLVEQAQQVATQVLL